MQSLGISPVVIERCLNHVAPQRDRQEVNPKLVRVYQQYGYANEMCDAWQRLGHYLGTLLSTPVDSFDVETLLLDHTL
ncbi:MULTISPECIES: hypothetical protein [unclassified Paraburkholderia]|nr:MULTISPECIES: hypothetical protein [unclassified Paraburkholderia]MBB5412987.1 hypothetical protein [Paraburkholderia sp. HC6.4b]MBB5455274.1 hypothetical protein [Paraburkholderia sp. Kb1A]MBC8720536.1 hypothetical protein [Paraburkholderia sp. 31.1]